MKRDCVSCRIGRGKNPSYRVHEDALTPNTKGRHTMLRKIALVTITAAALVAPPSLVHAGINLPNGVSVNGTNLNSIVINGTNLNGMNLPNSVSENSINHNNGVSVNGTNLNSIVINGVSVNGITLNGVEPAGREVYFVGTQARGGSSTILTIELPQGHVAR